MGAPRFVMEDFWPSDLFLGGIPGAWYDPTDLSTMFQDSTGTTPVTAVEQPVGLILDKSQGLALGAEVVANGGFSSGASWTLGAGGGSATIAAGLLTLSGGAAAFPNATQSGILTAGRWYRVTVVLTTPITLNSLSFRMGGGTTTYSGFTAAGTYTLTLLADGTNLVFLRNSGFTDTVNVDSVSVRELAGNHASQSTAASRPTYRARYNLLTFSEQFDNAAWTKYVDTTISANVAVAPDGTTTADLMYPATSGTRGLYMAWSGTLTLTTSLYAKASGKSWLQIIGSGGATASGVWFNLTAGTVGTQKPGYTGTIQSVGNGWYRCVVSHPVQTNGFFEYRVVDADNVSVVTATGGADGLLIWGAQALTAADVTATGNAYQRIAAATVYDTAPIFRPYLAFDGVDDSLATAAINFTSTDKMSVFSGVTKLSDAALGNVVELGNRNLVQAGSFTLIAPRSAGNPNYAFIVEGTAVTDNTITGYPAPITNVMTGRADISAPLNQLRVNGAVAGTLTTTLGTGNFGTWPLFIGRRNNASLPFNGRIYELIVRGATSSTTEIADTELWVNARTGAF